MAKIGQHYYTAANMNEPNIWENKKIIKVGVQGEPGAQFVINNISTGQSITLGSTGIYELDVTDIGVLTSFFCVNLNEGSGMYVDYIYEEAEGDGT